MTTHVVDTSALVKYVLPEQDSSVAERLIALHRTGVVDLIASQYILVESANVLWKQLQRRNLLSEEAAASFAALRNLSIRLVPDAELVESALTIAADNGITVYGALFCALAVRESVPLITSDHALVRRVAGSGVHATLLSDWNAPG